MLLRRSLSSAHTPVTVGIRREDPRRIWERRAPLTPDDVHKLVSAGVAVQIEPCSRRIFPDAAYVSAGAQLTPSLATSPAHIVLGIKEPPLSEVPAAPVPAPTASFWQRYGYPTVPRTHLMFSHTAKGQTYNIPLLAKFLVPGPTTSPEFRPRLIDYELLTDAHTGKRSIGFGWFAGGTCPPISLAGVLESLSSAAHSHLENGIATPFLVRPSPFSLSTFSAHPTQSTPRPHTHPTLASLQTTLRSIGEQVAQGAIPPALGPFVIGLTGTGNVAQGCLDILQYLPIENVQISNLHALVTNPDTPLNKIYLAHALPKDYLVRLDGQPYDRAHYYTHPQSYRSTFCETVAPYLTLFLNGTGWSPNFPRLMTNNQLIVALDRARTFPGWRFTNVGDISCDIEGGLEFLTHSTTLSAPSYNLELDLASPSSLPPVRIMAVDILPAALPLDASVHFSRTVLGYVSGLVRGYQDGAGWVGGGVKEEDAHGEGEGEGARGEWTREIEELGRATIACGGRLVGEHRWLGDGVDAFWEGGSAGGRALDGVERGLGKKQRERGGGGGRKKRVLMLGSGMVARPAVEEIAKRGDVQLVVASNSLVELERLGREFLNIQYKLLDIDVDDNEGGAMDALIEEADVVVRKHLVTASYIAPDTYALHERAVQADLVFLNEIGLDPGIDHVSALDLIARLRSEGKIIKSFTSFCGGLPAPNVEHTPLRYKFSWNPNGVLVAGLNRAKFLLNMRVRVC
ncbi:hypothetical protein C0995_003874 [Termitomyces sp. Mi166|nr:hypothetical protein C0995_003874 [Termitomyces sp. Mi166\